MDAYDDVDGHGDSNASVNGYVNVRNANADAHGNVHGSDNSNSNIHETENGNGSNILATVKPMGTLTLMGSRS